MSATNRGKEKIAQEHYVTPEHTINEMLNKCVELGIEFNDSENILDPCAGGGIDESHPDLDIKIHPPYPLVISNYFSQKKIYFKTIDIRPESPVCIHEDYLKMSLFINKFDKVISNPPFTLFQGFVKKAYEDVKENGYIIYLLRLNALGSQKRKIFWQMYPAKYCLVHSKRPSFMPGGGTDATEYAHFIWQKGYFGPTLTYVI